MCHHYCWYLCKCVVAASRQSLPYFSTVELRFGCLTDLGPVVHEIARSARFIQRVPDGSEAGADTFWGATWRSHVLVCWRRIASSFEAIILFFSLLVFFSIESWYIYILIDTLLQKGRALTSCDAFILVVVVHRLELKGSAVDLPVQEDHDKFVGALRFFHVCRRRSHVKSAEPYSGSSNMWMSKFISACVLLHSFYNAQNWTFFSQNWETVYPAVIAEDWRESALDFPNMARSSEQNRLVGENSRTCFWISKGCS